MKISIEWILLEFILYLYTNICDTFWLITTLPRMLIEVRKPVVTFLIPYLCWGALMLTSRWVECVQTCHTLFVDNFVIFYKSDGVEINRLKEILKLYKFFVWPCNELSKFKHFFSTNIDLDAWEYIQHTFGITSL